ALLAQEDAADAQPQIVARLIERAAAPHGELSDARQRRTRNAESSDLLDRNAAAVEIQRIRRIPPDECRAGNEAVAFRELRAVDANAGAVEAQRRRRLLERLAIRDPVLNRHRAKANRPLIRSRQPKVSAQDAADWVLVDFECVTKAVQVAPRHAEARVD